MKRTGERSILFEGGAYVSASACVAGKKEGEGPLGDTFDEIISDDLLGTDTWEKAESELFKKAVKMCAEKSGKISRRRPLERRQLATFASRVAKSGSFQIGAGTPIAAVNASISSPSR